MTMRIKVDTAGLSSILQQMNEKVNGAVRPAAQAAAQVLYDNVKRNVASIGKVTGNLQNSIYQVYSKKNSSETKATYEVSYNKQKAPHGHWFEYGYIRRYKVYLKKGQWHTAVRPEARGKPKPKRNASQAEKDAYYVTLPVPIQVAAKPFIRPTILKFNDAMDSARDKIIEMLNKDYT